MNFTSAVINCKFETDFCDWTNIENDPGHKWVRLTGTEVGENPGPDGDLNGDSNKYFVLASNFEESQSETSSAVLESPYFKSTEHPYECFNFYFYFGVM